MFIAEYWFLIGNCSGYTISIFHFYEKMKRDLGKAHCNITFDEKGLFGFFFVDTDSRYHRCYAVSKSQIDFWKLTTNNLSEKVRLEKAQSFLANHADTEIKTYFLRKKMSQHGFC